jgi:hypothetical protein
MTSPSRRKKKSRNRVRKYRPTTPRAPAKIAPLASTSVRSTLCPLWTNQAWIRSAVTGTYVPSRAIASSSSGTRRTSLIREI